MLIFTTKLSRKRAVAIILVLAIILCAVVLVAGMRDKKNAKELAILHGQMIETNEDRVKYLGFFGWSVAAEPIDAQEIVIPREFTGVYEEYGRLQDKQGFDLSSYSGETATRYTYEILNYPTGESGILADIIICKNTVIAGDIQSPSLNGFMHGLDINA